MQAFIKIYHILQQTSVSFFQTSNSYSIFLLYLLFTLWGTTSLHELIQCSSNYILRCLIPLNFDVTSLSLYHIGSFTSIRCLDSLYSEETSI